MWLLDVFLGSGRNLACTWCAITPCAREPVSPRGGQAMRSSRPIGCRDISLTGGGPTVRGFELSGSELTPRLGVAVCARGLAPSRGPVRW